jgi:predicted porin
MKKSLIAMSVLGAFVAGSATAANVEIYGLINPALMFTSSNGDYDGAETKNQFSMEEGKEFGSRWGLRGMEEISPDFKVGFVLESGFRSDTGALGAARDTGRIFDRESHIDLHTKFGKFQFGRMPLFGSVLGADGLFRAIDPLFANYTVAFGSGSVTGSDWTRVDNAISYVTPTFAGLTGYAMYSFRNDSNKTDANGDPTNAEESKAEADRYASLALRYQNGALEAVLVADMTMYGSVDSPAHETEDVDNGFTVTLGGNYEFSNGFKLIAFGQYFKDQYLNHNARAGVTLDGVNWVTERNPGVPADGSDGYGFVDGYGLSLGANYPLGGGTIKGQVAYRDMDNTKDVDFNRWFVALGYDYPMSKRTSFFAMTGYTQEKVEAANREATPYGFEFTAGILHRF